MALSQEKQTVIVDAIVMNAYTNEVLQGVEVISLESNVSETSGANGEAILKIPGKDVQRGVLHIRKIKSGYQTEDEWVSIANKATFLRMKPIKVVAPTNVRATKVEDRQSYAAAPTEDTSSLLKLYALVERSARLAGDNPSRALILCR